MAADWDVGDQMVLDAAMYALTEWSAGRKPTSPPGVDEDELRVRLAVVLNNMPLGEMSRGNDRVRQTLLAMNQRLALEAYRAAKGKEGA